MKFNSEDIEKVINGINGMFEEEEQKMYLKFIEHCPIKSYDNYDEFYIGFVYQFEQLISSIVKNNVSNNDDVVFIYERSQFIENHFQKLIEKYENFTCCVDKSRTIMKSLINFFITGERIVFDYNAEYTYHLPKKIFTSHDDIVEFFKGLQDLYYGNPTKYLETLKIITENLKEDKDEKYFFN